jgi:uncharacterized protein DUF6511
MAAYQDRGAKVPRSPNQTAKGVALCALCGREARGFGYCHGLRWGHHPYYRFCSMACLKVGANNARKSFAVINKTDMEIRAIRDARKQFASALSELGLMSAFQKRPASDIDRIISACIEGFQTSMQRQSDNGDIPF